MLVILFGLCGIKGNKIKTGEGIGIHGVVIFFPFPFVMYIIKIVYCSDKKIH